MQIDNLGLFDGVLLFDVFRVSVLFIRHRDNVYRR